MQLSLTSQNDTATCVAIQGDISQSRFPANVNNPLENVLGADCYQRRVLIDMEQAGYIDSSGIGWLMGCHKRFIAAGGLLVLHSLPPMVEQVIQLLRLHNILTIKPDQASALAQLSTVKGQS
jgi:anti-sigma B factor antagonist